MSADHNSSPLVRFLQSDDTQQAIAVANFACFALLCSGVVFAVVLVLAAISRGGL